MTSETYKITVDRLTIDMVLEELASLGATEVKVEPGAKNLDGPGDVINILANLTTVAANGLALWIASEPIRKRIKFGKNDNNDKRRDNDKSA